jgi:hypothetical protein
MKIEKYMEKSLADRRADVNMTAKCELIPTLWDLDRTASERLRQATRRRLGIDVFKDRNVQCAHICVNHKNTLCMNPEHCTFETTRENGLDKKADRETRKTMKPLLLQLVAGDVRLTLTRDDIALFETMSVAFINQKIRVVDHVSEIV